jgi:hypothetical protein
VAIEPESGDALLIFKFMPIPLISYELDPEVFLQDPMMKSKVIKPLLWVIVPVAAAQRACGLHRNFVICKAQRYRPIRIAS